MNTNPFANASSIVNVKFKYIAASSILFFLITSAFSQNLTAENSAETPAEIKNTKFIKRTVLILDFVNNTGSADINYLQNSIPEAFYSPLQQTGSFEMISRDRTIKIIKDSKIDMSGLSSEANAIILGKKAGVNVVVNGSFVRVVDKIQIQAKAIDITAGRVSTAQTRESNIDSTLFSNIDKLATGMAESMKKELPMLTEQEAMKEQLKGTFSRNGVSLMLATGSGFGLSSQYLENGFGLESLVSYDLFGFMLHPIGIAGFHYNPGIAPMESMINYHIQAGMLLPMKLNPDMTVGFQLTGGTHAGTIERWKEYEFMLPSLGAGLLFDYFIDHQWSITLSVTVNYLLDNDTSIILANIYLGGGWHFR